MMWTVTNHTPYAAGHAWNRDRDGVHEWIVAVKASYLIARDGSLSLAPAQDEPLVAPEYTGDPGASSLRYDADLVPTKPATDILINGTAHAPGRRPSTEFFVGMRLGPIQKVLRVRGDRVWQDGALGPTPSPAKPVLQVPIVYERAFGGYDHLDSNPQRHRLDPRNPVGCGVAAQPEHLLGRPVANFEYVDGGVEKTGPAGFGPIDSWWSPRRELAGTYDLAWNDRRRPLLPLDWQPESLLCAPADQRPSGHLRGGEVVEVANLTEDGRLAFALPKVFLNFTTRGGGRKEDHRPQLTTVILEPDQRLLRLVWVGTLPWPTDVDYLEETVVREKRLLT